MASLYTTLADGLSSLATASWETRTPLLSAATGPGPLAPLDPAELRAEVEKVWAAAGGGESSSGGRRLDVVRSTLDLVGRDVAERPVVDGLLPEPLETDDDDTKRAFQTALQDRLDIALTLYEVAYDALASPALEPGAVFIPLLEDFVELLSVATWRQLFGYLETRSKRFSKNMPSSKGKALPLLRTINAFLRFLSHTPEDLMLRGRVQLFAAAVIPIADKSAINMRGEYSAIQTTWEESDPQGDVEMAEAGDGGAAANDDEKPKAEPNFYSTLWSLQGYFAYPPSLDGPAVGDPTQTAFEQFRAKTEFVLSRLYEQTKRERVLRGKDDGSAPATVVKSGTSADDFYPRYLTAKSLLEYEIADQSFRRQILVQYFILFQFLLNFNPASASKQQFTGGMPKTFVIDGDNLEWTRNTAFGIRDELSRMSADGYEFFNTMAILMERERRYALWKNEGCPEAEWEIKPVDPQEVEDAAKKWEEHVEPMRRWPHRLGTPALTRVWDLGFKSMDNFRETARKNPRPDVFELEEELSRIEMDEEDDKAMGREPSAAEAEVIAEKKQTVKWMAFRQARRLYPAEVAKLGNAVGADRDLHQLVKLIREREAAASAARQAPGHDSVPPEEAHEEGDGVDPVAEEEVEGADTPAEGGEEAADGEAKGDEEADLEVKEEDAEAKVNGESHEASQAASPEKEQEQGNGHAEGDAEAMAVDPAPEEQPAVEAVAVTPPEPTAAPIIDADMAEAE
ncbi:THO complex subunit 1 [Vanrija pseudolonga]|uniref:THO complex subunit 1 n=1 Tax=Vanrija pseudolonga TaxID=143232 RepID=A0AAF0Y971_9TREE|nr:THO complex subunit 1 [Vanrija pseudolonga]